MLEGTQGTGYQMALRRYLIVGLSISLTFERWRAGKDRQSPKRVDGFTKGKHGGCN
jgi:hypothetical protein